MKLVLSLILAFSFFCPAPGWALSTRIGRDIDFPENFDSARAAAIRAVVQDEHFAFVDGVVSHWPPDFGTRLSFKGDAASLNAFFEALRKIPGVGLHLILYRGRNDEMRRDTPWQLDFSKAHPDQLTVYLNLNAEGFDFGQLKLPDWPPTPNPSTAGAASPASRATLPPKSSVVGL